MTPTNESKLRSSNITGSGRYCPKKVLTNDDLEKIVETSDEWITTRTGIKERRIVGDGEACSACGASIQRIFREFILCVHSPSSFLK